MKHKAAKAIKYEGSESCSSTTSVRPFLEAVFITTTSHFHPQVLYSRACNAHKNSSFFILWTFSRYTNNSFSWFINMLFFPKFSKPFPQKVIIIDIQLNIFMPKIIILHLWLSSNKLTHKIQLLTDRLK